MRRWFAILGILAAGCSPSVGVDPLEGQEEAGADAETPTDASTPTQKDSGAVDARVDTHTSTVDTGTVADTRVTTDTSVSASSTCPKPLPSGFACVAPTAKKGRKVCSEAAIQAYVPACFGSAATSEKCTAVKKKYPSCDTCVLTDWLDGSRIDIAACVLAISPTTPCPNPVHCGYDCLDAVCGACSAASGTGSSGISEKYDCYNSQSKSSGQCWSKGMNNYAACAGSAQFALCFPATNADLVPFFRGACRDGGVWSNALSP